MKAALLTKLNAPLEICELERGALDYGQVFVKVLVSGICGAQLQEISGAKKGGPLPHPLGHEGCGIVQEVGPGVLHVRRGDKVVMHWRPGAGVESDYPTYITAEDKTITGGKVTTFSEHSICSENRLTAVPMETPNEFCALLGCGLSTALGTLENEAKLLRGESILIVGCGGLGMNLVLAARATHAGMIVGTDVIDKKEAVCELGAHTFWKFDAPLFCTHPPMKFDVIVETSGNPIAIQATLPMLAPSGRYVMVGQPKPEQQVTLNDARHFFEGEGKSLRATQGGRYRPHLDIPRYLSCLRNGDLSIDGIVSHRLPLERINEGLDWVRQGMASRVMIEMEG